MSNPARPHAYVARALVLIAAWAVLTGILMVVGEGVEHSSTLNAFDRHVTSWIVAHRSSTLDAVMKAVTWLGSWIALVATAVVVIVLVVSGRLPRLAVVLAVVAWAGEAGGVSLTKVVVHRPRPPEHIRLIAVHGWSWPSGHTAVAVVVFTVLAMVLQYLFRDRLLRAFVWGFAVLFVAAVGFSRIELGVHWTTDVLGSLVFVTSWLIVLATLIAVMSERSLKKKVGEHVSPVQPGSSFQPGEHHQP